MIRSWRPPLYARPSVDPRRAVHVAPLADRYREEIAAERLLALSLTVLGGSTLLLSVFGIVALVGQLEPTARASWRSGWCWDRAELPSWGW